MVGDERLRRFQEIRTVGGKWGQNKEIRQRSVGESGAIIENNLAMSECGAVA